MSGRILVVHGQGLGNIVQILPLLSAMDRWAGPTDLALANSSFDVPEALFPGRRVFLPEMPVPCGDYIGKVKTIWGDTHGKDVAPMLRILNDVGRQQMRLDCSEASVYLKIALELGVSDDMFSYDCSSLLGYEPTDERFDVVISNGYNWKAGDFWVAKSYPRYQEVVAMLKTKGLSVCSVGAKREYVPGTIDKTDIGLMKTLGLIKNCKVVIANDSGFYHCACALRKPCVVVFTFTSVMKNCDPLFHATALIVRRSLACQGSCHAKMTWRTCKRQECRDVPVQEIVDKALSAVSGCAR